MGSQDGRGLAPVSFQRPAQHVLEDLEVAAATGRRRDADITRYGIDFQIATRLTSWVAISEEPTVDPREPLRVERIPQELPHGMSAEGLGLGREQEIEIGPMSGLSNVKYWLRVVALFSIPYIICRPMFPSRMYWPC